MNVMQKKIAAMRENNTPVSLVVEEKKVDVLPAPKAVEVPKKQKIDFLLPTKVSQGEANQILDDENFDCTLVTAGGQLRVLDFTKRKKTLFVVEEGRDFSGKKILMKKFPMGKFKKEDISLNSLFAIEMAVLWAVGGDEKKFLKICWWNGYENIPYYVITLIREFFEETYLVITEEIMYELAYIEIFKQYLKKREKMVYFFFFKKVEAVTIVGKTVDFDTLNKVCLSIKRNSREQKIEFFEICEGSPVSNSETGESFIYTHEAILEAIK